MTTTFTAPQGGKIGKTLRQMRKYWFCYVGLMGTFALLIAFSYYPAFSAIYHSFTVWDGSRPARWNGIANYKEIFSNPNFLTSYKNLAILSIWAVFRSISFPMLAAALLYRLRSEKTAYFFRLLFVLPIVIPGLVGILMWQQIYQPSYGLLNELLKALGMKTLAWLNDPSTALPSLMFVGFPWIDGVGMLIFLAGFLGISRDVIEAAIMDGCTSLRRFFAIELPLIVPQLRVMIILSTIGTLQGFGWQLAVTRGGPMKATTVPAWEMYYAAIFDGRFGVGSAIGVVLFLIILAITLINLSIIRSSNEVDSRA
jgi:raffinose/stachyose/melibiose transport system permease protein